MTGFWHKIRILVVDDEESIRRVLRDFLGKRGCRVLTAATLAEARQILTETVVHLAIVDVVVGEDDGLLYLDEMHALYPRLPVLILAGIGYDEEALQEALQKGAAGYFSKTLGLSKLQMEIHRILGSLMPSHDAPPAVRPT